jgi:hypothetical protein
MKTASVPVRFMSSSSFNRFVRAAMRKSRGRARRELPEIIENTRPARTRDGSKAKRRVHREPKLGRAPAARSRVPQWNVVSK